jgi:hypothetical protein
MEIHATSVRFISYTALRLSAPHPSALGSDLQSGHVKVISVSSNSINNHLHKNNDNIFSISKSQSVFFKPILTILVKHGGRAHFKRLVAGILFRRLEFKLCPACVGFVLDRGFSLKYPSSPVSVISPVLPSHISFICHKGLVIETAV